jgi:RHS repeat-associated protein
VFLVPEAKVPAGWRRLSEAEAASVRGGLEENTNRAPLEDDEDEDCPTDEEAIWFPADPTCPASPDPEPCPPPERCPPGRGQGGCGGLGLASWHVSEPFINLWVKDVPLYYTMSDGRMLPFILRYRQRNDNQNTNVFGVGKSWECSWLAYGQAGEGGSLIYRVPGGGRRAYPTTGGRGMMGESVSVSESNGEISVSIRYRTTCSLELGERFIQPGTTLTNYLLSRLYDAAGRTIRFNYQVTNGVKRLIGLVDFDGQTNRLGYDDINRPDLVRSVTDPYGRTAYLSYDGSGNLTNITDIQGLSSGFQYNASGLLTAMITPYGTTRFDALTNEVDPDSPIARGLWVTQPNGSHNLFAYREYTASMPTNCPAPGQFGDRAYEFPEGYLHFRNSYFWNAKQLETITNSWTNLVLQPDIPAGPFQQARLRHWAWRNAYEITPLTRKLLVERPPSPDGTAQGHPLWYLYDPASLWPTVRAERVGASESRYTVWVRNDWGLPTERIESYQDGGAVGERSWYYEYEAGDERLLTKVYEPLPNNQSRLAREYAYSDRNQLTDIIEHVESRANWSEATHFTYAAQANASGGWNYNLTGALGPNGLLMTNVLDTNTFLVTSRKWYADSINGTCLATNTFTWATGKVTTATDARNLTVTHFWDDLGRLTGLGYPDGSAVSNLYFKLDNQPFTNSTGGTNLLDRTRTQDRMGNWTSFTYDAMRQLTAVTNALTNTTAYGWCSCGTLESVTDPLGTATTYDYDLAGRLTTVHRQGTNLVLRVAWNELDVSTNLSDNLGSLTLTFNHQGLWTGATNGFGLWQRADYDLYDRPTNAVAADGRRVAIAYDSNGRVLERQMVWTNGTSTEQIGYTPNVTGAVAYTNQLGTGITLLAYDGFGRLTNQVFAGLATNRFAYTAAGDLASLTDGKDQTTAWTYDAEGRALTKTIAGQLTSSNAYNANGWLVTNWTPARPNVTSYGYDALGQLTSAQGKDPGGAVRAHEKLAYVYDAAGNLTARTNNGFAQTFVYSNSFNQLGSVSRSGTFTAAGLVQSATNVTVTVKANAETNGSSATVYVDRSFARPDVTLTNGNNTFTAVATDSFGRTATHGVTAWLPATAAFVYDLNGNLTSDGRRGFAYDDADQLTSVTVTNAWRSEFTYDALGRRRVRIEKVWKSNQWVTASETRYVYDHMLVLQERNGLNLPTATYTRGPDMSGGLQRAGGIGGLLALTQPSPISPQHFYYHADAGGNVTVLTDTRQAVAARYRYDPYGNLLGLAGPMAELNLYRFSSKEFHSASGLYYYGYRFSEPSLQRWINRDPIRETAGVNVYLFVENSPANRLDALGLWSKKAHEVIFVYSLGKSLPRELIDELARSSEYFDTQSMSDAYKHSLRSKGQDPLDAVTQRNAFVKQRIRCAQQEYYYSGDLSIAMHTLAEAMHAASDSTCPVHQDAHGQPRVWTQPISPNALGHGQWEWVGDETAHDLSAPLLLKNRAILQQILVDFYGYE